MFSTCWTRPCAWCLCEPVCVILGNKGAFRIHVRIWEEIKILLFFFWLEINLGDKCLDGVLNNNHYESDILKDYLASRGLTWKNMLNESLLALQRGVFMLSDYRITGNTVLCYCCGLRSFRELAYQYRQNIPVAELPVTVTSRPDCYWGRNCRTQVKAHHAMKFNHICEQTRFKNWILVVFREGTKTCHTACTV